MPETKSQIQAAVDRLGGASKVAALMGVSTTAVRKWVKAERIPLERMMKFCSISDLPPSAANKDVKKLFDIWAS